MIESKLNGLAFITLIIFSTLTTIVPSKAQQNPVTIGIPLPLSGSFNEFGVMMKNSFEMAKDVINMAEGIKGRPLEIIFADDKGDVDFVKSAFDRLVFGIKPTMLVGGYASDPTYYLARMAEKEDIPFLICTA